MHICPYMVIFAANARIIKIGKKMDCHHWGKILSSYDSTNYGLCLLSWYYQYDTILLNTAIYSSLTAAAAAPYLYHYGVIGSRMLCVSATEHVIIMHLS